MATIKIDLAKQCLWYCWYNIISNRYPNAGIDYVIKQVNEIVYKNRTMNENIDLTKILKDCPEGTVFWSDNYGEVKFIKISPSFDEPIVTRRTDGYTASYTKEGWHNICFPANCLLWPSRDCRDWAKFTAPWLKKERFDPQTLKAFDKVVVRNIQSNTWRIEYFSHIDEKRKPYPFYCLGDNFAYCIPYNDDTKHLVGTTGEAPEFYRYWED